MLSVASEEAAEEYIFGNVQMTLPKHAEVVLATTKQDSSTDTSIKRFCSRLESADQV